VSEVSEVSKVAKVSEVSRWSVAMHFAPGSAGFVFSSGVCVNGKCVVLLYNNWKGHVFGLKFLAVRTNLLGIF
jgi:hypothetical protein